jgi:predicted short-subunit dehydrogenase-like oxidoreductase (DUF2520 family)
LGSSLAVALETAGYQIDALVARRKARARRALRLLDGNVLALAQHDLNQLPPSKLTVISTPDDAIEDIAGMLADLQTGDPTGQVFLHTSGALSSAALEPLAEKGFAVGSLHPLAALSDPQKGADSLRGVFWCVEGDRSAVKLARQIVNDLEGQSFSITADKKPLYHAAAVMVSGHAVALFDIAIEMLAQTGLTEAKAREILLPLVASNARNLLTVKPARALTGSFARGDLATVQRHLRALSVSGLKDALRVYRLLGLRSLKLARETKADPRALKQIKKLLEAETAREPGRRRD